MMSAYSSDIRNPRMKPKQFLFKGTFILLSIVALVGAISCSQSKPYRTALPSTPTNKDCKAEESNRTPEISNHYELHFVEFDDQGWLHPEPAITSHNCDAYKQLDFLMESLNKKMEKDTASDLSIILYIHGWKHNAYYKDENVDRFRSVLQDISQLEREVEKHTGQRQRNVVGIYVGWRGQSLDLPGPLENITFWDRKAAALRVAQGSARELLARLRGFQRDYNTQNSNCRFDPENPSMRPHCKIRLLLIGHSFGAWVLYSATSGWLIQTAAAGMDGNGKQDDADKHAGVERFADLVVLLNPAFEGSRYEPLHRVAQGQIAISPQRRRPYYEPPVLVTVTSETDWATNYAFWFGRLVSSVLQRPVASSEQSEAITNTPGHIDRYITHELDLDLQNDPCQAKGYRPEERNSEAAANNYTAEEEIEDKFFKKYKQGNHEKYVLEPGWERPFCGGAVLIELGTKRGKEYQDPNSIVWNVRAKASVMDGHNDITKPALISFIRQIYHELIHRLPDSNQAAATMTGTVAPRRAMDVEKTP